jgi:glycosyltransferase involved in cell wall biosynthesis
MPETRPSGAGGRDPERLRELLGEIGAFPPPLSQDHLVFVALHPRLAFLSWHVRPDAMELLRAARGDVVDRGRLVIRVYDVTDILFDGYNAHWTQDVPVASRTGVHYQPLERLERNLLAELGLVLDSGEFCPLVRSATAFFDRERPARKLDASGLYVSSARGQMFAVDNVLDAVAYERLHSELNRGGQEPLHLAVALVRLSEEMGARLLPLLDAVGQRCRSLGGDARFFSNPVTDIEGLVGLPLIETVDALADRLYDRLFHAHEQRPFHVLHCHDWYTAGVGSRAQQELRLPFVLSLHSTERERAGQVTSPLSRDIAARERLAVREARLVIVPHEAAFRDVVEEYGGQPERVLVVPSFPGAESNHADPPDVKRTLGFHPDWPLVLFAGELSHSAGADILLDAICTVARRSHEPQFAFAGDGYMKTELESRAWQAGLGHRVRFLGDVRDHVFARLLAASDFLVVPAREPQNAAVVERANALGKPVLATHQAALPNVVHGQNGLLTFDNPGSIVWGVDQLLSNPRAVSRLRVAAMRATGRITTLDRMVVEHYLAYARARRAARGGAP